MLTVTAERGITMANNEGHNEYDELRKRYGGATDVPEKTEKPKAPPVKQASSTQQGQSRTRHYSPPPVSDSPREKSTYKGGVYFSNPPRNMEKEAQRQRNGAGEMPASGRRVPNMNNTAKRKAPPQKQKGIKGFFKSEGFKRAMISFAIIIGVSAILCFYGIRCINDVLALNVDEPESVEVTIQSGMTDGEVLEILQDNDLINNKLFCKLFVSFFSQDGDYIGGSYTLTTDMGVEKMLATMKTDFRGNETVTLTFPEGWTINQIAEKLESNDVCSASSFISTLQDVDFSAEYDFIADIPDKELRFHTLEGYIYPDTYEFYVGENASSVVRRFLDNFENKWTDEYKAQADKLGVTVDEVVIMASILQMEAADTEQMPTIAGILYNRLDNPSAFPLLQCDSTEDYLLETIKPSLTSSVEDTQRYVEYKDLYDTYADACVGLPVGAIANPGNAAINAALYPEDTSYLYFRHDKKGGIYYADSFAEHQANASKAAEVDG